MYNRVNLDVLGGGYGVSLGFHALSINSKGESKPFNEVVNNYPVEKLVSQIKEMGANHYMLTLTSKLQYMPCPNPVLDSLMPNRTCERDLVGELADALNAEGIKLLVYYHHGVDGANQDPEWWQASGAYDYNSETFYNNYCDILTYIGEKYGEKISAYWFDAGYGLFRRGHVPWEKLTKAAKAGFSDRPITYNPGVRDYGLYTEFQDYYSGETGFLSARPMGKTVNTGLYEYCFLTLHEWWMEPQNTGCATWEMEKGNMDYNWKVPDSKAMAEFVKAFNAVGAPVTINLLDYNDGEIHSIDKEAIMKMREYL